MKNLDKENLKSKKNTKNVKKAIIVGASSLAIVTLLCGTIISNFMKNSDSKILRIARSVMSGTVFESLSQEILESGVENGVEFAPTISEGEVLALEEYLKKLGFGYSYINLYGMNPTGNEEWGENYEFVGDSEGTYIGIEALYALCEDKNLLGYRDKITNNEELSSESKDEILNSGNVKPVCIEKPEDLPKIECEITNKEYVETGKLGDVYKYSYTAKLKAYQDVLNDDLVDATVIYNGEFIGIDMSEAELENHVLISVNNSEIFKERLNKNQEKYNDAVKLYENWIKWKSARNKWIDEVVSKGYLNEKEPEGKWTEYTKFWVKVAQRVFGLNVGTSDEDLKNLTNYLYAQIFEDGVELEHVRNICHDQLMWIYEGRDEDNHIIVNPPIEAPELGEAIPGDGSGGETIPGDNSGEGTTPGDGSGGETIPEGDSGGETVPSEPQGEGPKVKKASITFPTSGVYKTGKEIKISVYFDKNVYGTQEKGAINVNTAPRLTIKFGTKEGGNKIALFDSVTEDTIIYKYTIADSDNGQLQIGDGSNYIGTVYSETGAKSQITNIEKLETDKIIIANNATGPVTDEVAPSIKNATIVSPESGTYKNGQQIKIAVNFNKNIYGTKQKGEINVNTAPKLYIKFGENAGNKIALFDSVEGSTITYRYTISKTDKGQLFIGDGNNYVGTVYNESGIEVKLNTIARLETDKIIVVDNTSTNPVNPSEPTTPDNSTTPDNPVSPTDPANPGDSEEVDKTALKIEKITISSPVNGTYRKGQEIRLTVNFDKNVYGDTKKVAVNEKTAPKLLIRFGNEEENKTAKFESSTGKMIVYKYNIEDTENGQLFIGSGDNFIGTVYNEFGEKTEFRFIEKIEEDRIIIADNIGPSVQKIQTMQEAGNYKTGSEIQIKVSFNEAVYGTKNGIRLVRLNAPILNITFDDGEIKHPVVKTINNTENYLIYSYIIKQEDRGTLNVRGARAFDGTKKIYDAVGNEVTLIAAKDLTGNIITANNNLTQITVDKKEITLDLNGNKTTTITATATPTVTLTWNSTNPKVATVDNTGNVTALAIGETDITIISPDGTEVTCKVTVKDTSKGITKVELNNKKLELDLNGSKTANLIATVTPEQLGVTWSSTDENIVKVDQTTGLVTAVSKGTAEIIAKAEDGTTAVCEVNVINSNKEEIEPTAIGLNITNAKVILGKTQTLQLITTIEPTNSNKNTQIAYESSDENVLTVDNTGKVTIKAKGMAIITASTENGINAYCAIEVIEIVEQPELQTRKIGDINGDEKIDITDLLAILRYIAVSASSTVEEKHQDWNIKDEKFILADVNGNGVIDITDALKVQRHMAASASETVKANHPDWILETNWNNN